MQKAEENQEQTIEKNTYQQNDLVTFKFPAKLPYYTNTKLYEMVNGEVDVNGVIMSYVKKRIYNDSIEYVCLPNTQKNCLRTAREDFFKLVNDFQTASAKNHSSKAPIKNIKPFSFDAISFQQKNQTAFVEFIVNKKMLQQNTRFISTQFLQLPLQPPDAI